MGVGNVFVSVCMNVHVHSCMRWLYVSLESAKVCLCAFSIFLLLIVCSIREVV